METTASSIRPSVYNVEFEGPERRLVERCTAQQRINSFLSSGERRFSPGRREHDLKIMELQISLLLAN
jgi:hypothetical protein